MKNLIRLLSLSSVFVLLCAFNGNAQSLTTLFASNNDNEGIMFDIEALNAISIDRFDINLQASGNVAVFYKVGTHVGFEASPGAWTSLGTYALTTAGIDNPTSLVLNSPLNVASGQTIALYMTGTALTIDLQYTDGTGTGSISASNSDLIIYEGQGIDYAGGALFGATNSDRIWNGTIYYSLALSIPTVSEWGLMAFLTILGSLGLSVLYRRKEKMTIA